MLLVKLPEGVSVTGVQEVSCSQNPPIAKALLTGIGDSGVAGPGDWTSHFSRVEVLGWLPADKQQLA
jgi:hypothetical protein